MVAQCDECKQNINNREFLICVTCGRKYDLTCANVSSQRFHLMTIDNKKNWKCQSCWLDFHKEKENITNRKKIIVNVSTENSFSSLDDDEIEISSNSIDLNRSCPGPRSCFESDLQDLKIEINMLNLKLEAADSEIINLLKENSTLQKQLQERELQNKQLKQICTAYDTKDTFTPFSGCSSQKKSNKINKLKRKTLNFSNSENATINIEEHYSPQDGATSSPKLQNTLNTDLNPPKHIQHKMCIISSNKRNRVLTTATSTIQNAKICHFLTPNVGLQQLLKNLEKKVQNYSMNDSCVLMIGDKDFETSMDYKSLVNMLRTELLKIQNTNVFICLPTFRHGLYTSLLFNERVDTFNNLLYRDNLTHEYAYVLDSNENLTYDNRMCTIFKGNLNNKGLRQVFKDLSSLVDDVMLGNLQNLPTELKKDSNHNSLINETQFFRTVQ